MNNLSQLYYPTFINELPTPFVNSMQNAMTSILNAKGNSATKQYRNFDWHNSQSNSSTKKLERHLHLVHLLRSFYVIHHDYVVIMENYPDLLKESCLSVNKENPTQLCLSFHPLSYKNYCDITEADYTIRYTNLTEVRNHETLMPVPLYGAMSVVTIDQFIANNSELLETIIPIYNLAVSSPESPLKNFGTNTQISDDDKKAFEHNKLISKCTKLNSIIAKDVSSSSVTTDLILSIKENSSQCDSVTLDNIKKLSTILNLRTKLSNDALSLINTINSSLKLSQEDIDSLSNMLESESAEPAVITSTQSSRLIDWPTTESDVKLQKPILSCLLNAEGQFIIPDLSRAEPISDFSSLYDLKD